MYDKPVICMYMYDKSMIDHAAYHHSPCSLSGGLYAYARQPPMTNMAPTQSCCGGYGGAFVTHALSTMLTKRCAVRTRFSMTELLIPTT